MMGIQDQECGLRTLASRLIMKLREVALRGDGRAQFLYVIGIEKSAEISWDENDNLWVQFWNDLNEDADPVSEQTFDGVEKAEKGIIDRLM